MSYPNIAIDGPAGAGKSTLARRLASCLGFVYVDTGALYRSIGLFVDKQGKSCAQPEEVIALLPHLQLSLRHEADGLQHMYLQEEDVTEQIRENRVSAFASQVSQIPEVRAFLLDLQRSLAKTQAVVMDGRDIGTVILPNAPLKIFLTASAQVRAERRERELRLKGDTTPFAVLLAEIEARDLTDSQRTHAPLKRAEDAVLLDTSHLNLDESLTALLALAKEHLDL